MRELRTGRIRGALLPAVCLLVAVTSCTSGNVEFIPEGGSYTSEQVEEMASSEAISELSETKVSDAEAARTEALIELRHQGELGREAADLLSKDFPTPARSIPVRVELAEVDGTPAWVVLEAWGREGKTLEHGRVWVFDRASGEVLMSISAE